MEAWDIEINKDNYAFLAGSSGVYRFNGYDLKKLEGRGEVGNVPVYMLFEGADKRIWAATVTNKLGYVEGDGLVPYRFNEQLDSINIGPLQNCYFDGQNTLHVSSRGKGYYTISAEGVVQEVLGRASGIRGVVFTVLPDGQPFVFSILQPVSDKQKRNLKLYFLQKDGRVRHLSDLGSHFPTYPPQVVRHPDGSYILSSGHNDLIKCLPDSVLVQSEFSNAIISLFLDKRQNLWVGTPDNGLHLVHCDRFFSKEHMLGNKAAAVVAEDKTGGLWVKASGNFFYYLSRPDIRSYSMSTGQLNFTKALVFTTDHQRIYCLNENNRIAVLEKDSVFYLTPPDNEPISGLRLGSGAPGTIYYDTISALLWVGYRGKVCSWDGKQWRHYLFPDKVSNDHRVVDFTVLPDSTLIVACPNLLFSLKPHSTATLLDDYQKRENRITGLTADPEGALWIGTAKGVYNLKEGELIKLNQTGVFADSINDFIKGVHYAHNEIWINTNAHGLYRLTGNSVQPVTYAGEVIRMQEVSVSKNGDLWGRSNDFNPKIIHIFFRNGQMQVEYLAFDVFGDLRAELVSGTLAVIDETVFLGMKSTIYRSELEDLKKNEPLPSVMISSFYVNNQHAHRTVFSDLKYDENSIQLTFEPVSYRRNELEFRYRMEGLAMEWQVVQHRNIQYTNLAPGDYTFQVQARIKGEEWGKADELNIHIQTPFWQTIWFRILVFAVLVLFVGGIFYIVNRARHRRARLIIDKLNAEQRALRAQMNPHFTYNALSSIQELVYRDNKYAALTNIAMFARLMRRVLDHSTKEQISLKDEIETLELYLKLEALRFEGVFEHNISVHPDIRPGEFGLPPGLIQPFVENSIKHGLLNKPEKAGTLLIDFKMEHGKLVCVIEDDGVGRKKSAEMRTLRNKEHRSFGTRAVFDRIHLLNISRADKIELEIFDRYGKNSVSVGTRVILTIP